MAMHMRVEQMPRRQTFELPTRIDHGIGVAATTGTVARELGISKALLVTDPGVRGAGVTRPVEDALTEAAIAVVVFDQVEPNPPVALVAKGTATYQEHGCDGLVAVGGGSSMDTAKAIGVEVVHGGSVLDYEAVEGKRPLTRRIPPLITLPTTSGTGSEVTQWAVITDEDREYKFNVGGPLIAAHVAIVDPELQRSQPARITAGTGIDALCHAIECYTMHYAQPVTDAVALLAIEYTAGYLRRAYASRDDIEARYGMSQAAMLAGMSYGSESAGAVHAAAQTLGGIVPVAHGDAVGALLVPVMEFNWQGDPRRYARVAQAMGVDTRGLSVEAAAVEAVIAVADLVRDVEIPDLEEQGVDREMIPRLAEEAFHDPQTIGNPRDLDVASYEWIYRRAFGLVAPTIPGLEGT
jgi:choline dehydrogenase